MKELQGMETRPTTGKVKESLFSIIQFDIEGRRVLDLFAGTGQLGIEALSRGAAECVFIDRRPDAVRLIQENLALCRLADRARVRQGDALPYLRSGEKFDLIFLDPPYASGLLDVYSLFSKEIVPVNIREIAQQGGCLNCISWEEPHA